MKTIPFIRFKVNSKNRLTLHRLGKTELNCRCKVLQDLYFQLDKDIYTKSILNDILNDNYTDYMLNMFKRRGYPTDNDVKYIAEIIILTKFKNNGIRNNI